MLQGTGAFLTVAITESVKQLFVFKHQMLLEPESRLKLSRTSWVIFTGFFSAFDSLSVMFVIEMVTIPLGVVAFYLVLYRTPPHMKEIRVQFLITHASGAVLTVAINECVKQLFTFKHQLLLDPDSRLKLVDKLNANYFMQIIDTRLGLRCARLLPLQQWTAQRLPAFNSYLPYEKGNKEAQTPLGLSVHVHGG
ncbi:unnamed protein product, partial [Mesorhabditis spiculigera]